MHLKFSTTCAWNVIGRAAQLVNVVTMDTADTEEQSCHRLVTIFTARRMKHPLCGMIHSNNELSQRILYIYILYILVPVDGWLEFGCSVD